MFTIYRIGIDVYYIRRRYIYIKNDKSFNVNSFLCIHYIKFLFNLFLAQYTYNLRRILYS